MLNKNKIIVELTIVEHPNSCLLNMSRQALLNVEIESLGDRDHFETNRDPQAYLTQQIDVPPPTTMMAMMIISKQSQQRHTNRLHAVDPQGS